MTTINKKELKFILSDYVIKSDGIKTQTDIDNLTSNTIDEIIKSLAIPVVSNSYAIVRWNDNKYEDVVCATHEVASEYCRIYNEGAKKQMCYIDERIWLPLTKA